MKKQVDHLRTVRNYLNGNENVSDRRFKKALDKLIESEDPEGLIIASGTPCRRMSWEELEKRQEKLLNKAVALEFVPAMVALAEFYYNQKNYKKAFELYERAAKLNNAYALKVLAYTYRGGWDGFEKDVVRAESLMKRAENGTVWSMSKGFDAERSDYE